MIRYSIIFLFLGIILFSCYHGNNEKNNEPETIVPFDKMANIVTDIQIAEGIIINNRSARMNMDKAYKDSLYHKIFHHHGITLEIFKDNINYYNNNPGQMEQMYELVLENLSKMQGEVTMNSQKKKEEIEDREDIKKDTIAVP